MNAKLSIQKVSPAQAKSLLANIFEEQRSVSNAHVKRLAAEMENNTWRLSPDCLLLIKGKLANGQHRLQAVVQSGITQQFIIMETDDDELYKVLDSGNKRTVADVLRGDYSRVVASVARNVALYDLELLALHGVNNNDGSATRSLIIEFARDNYEQLHDCVSSCYSLYTQFKIVTPALPATVLFIGRRDSKQAPLVNKFINDFYTGASNNDAARDLRERIMRSRIGTAARLDRFYILALCLKSLKAYLAGTRLNVIRLSEGEAFPRIK